ncbi:MAG: NusG domain II-containing protein [Oscillospiraceae bacterium]|nr:NusG domain II-containing protein [Oscillospiraceae bacterium]
MSSLIVWMWLNNSGYDNASARIYHEGELVHVIDLASVNVPYEIDVGNVIVQVRVGEIGVVYSDCRNKLCEKTGFVDGRVPIICIPNRLEIRVENNQFDFDGVTR